MRDGTVLLADVYRPREPGTYPVLLMRLPYDKDAAQTYVYAEPEAYASHCYIVVIQDVRGQYKSAGEFYPFRDEAADGYDTVEWAASSPAPAARSGCTASPTWAPPSGWPPPRSRRTCGHRPRPHQLRLLRRLVLRGRRLLARLPRVLAAHLDRAVGSRRLGDQAVLDRIEEAQAKLPETYEHLPIKDYPWLFPDRQDVAPYFYDWVEHDTWDDYWKRWSIRTRYGDVQVPALNFAGWYDVFMDGGIENFVGMRQKGGSEAARKGQRLVIGPWIHLPWEQKVGEVDFGPEAANPIDQLHLRWFDHWLKGADNGVDREPPVRVFVMGRTSGARPPTGPSPARGSRPTTCAAGERPTRASATARSRRSRPRATSRRTATATIRRTRSPARAGTPAAPRTWRRSARSIRPKSRSAPTCWCTARRRWSGRWR